VPKVLIPSSDSFVVFFGVVCAAAVVGFQVDMLLPRNMMEIESLIFNVPYAIHTGWCGRETEHSAVA
jgi:hypothetical protein